MPARKFLADAMLGSLARWLRVMGYDTHYQSHYREQVLGELISEGRGLLSRHRKTVSRYPGSLLILSDRVHEQLLQVREAGLLHPGDSMGWFTRCLMCNEILEKAVPSEARENVPDHVFHEKEKEISFCPSCRRYYWPGSHRERMIGQLRGWGFEAYPRNPIKSPD
ncbi:MAG: hypothetical protein JXL84_04185 [Deltaproteobacteria bacterium]|nr:hypothetical protein [Deltaproteobacteria bacterium]